MQKFVIASANEHKIKEFQSMLKPFDIKVVPYKSVVKEEFTIEENGKTFEENAKIKAEAICNKTGLPTFADDSGFCITELDDFPGIFSARYAESVGGYDKAFEEIYNKLGGRYSNAKFVCVIAFARPNEKTLTFRGECNGFTTFPSRGENGFGYDPIFVPNSYGKTFAEMEENEKNSISHRAFASFEFLKFVEELKKKSEKKTTKKVDVVEPVAPVVEEVKTEEVHQEVSEVNQDMKEESKDIDENIFSIEVDEKFDAPAVPFSNDETN